MNNIIMKVLGLFVVGITVMGPLGAADDPATADIADVKQEWSEALDSLQEYSAGQKDAAVQQAGDVLKEMDRKLEQLEDQARNDWKGVSDETRQARMDAIAELRAQRDELAKWYREMQGNSSRAWAEIQQGFSDAYEKLRESWGDARDEF